MTRNSQDREDRRSPDLDARVGSLEASVDHIGSALENLNGSIKDLRSTIDNSTKPQYALIIAALVALFGLFAAYMQGPIDRIHGVEGQVRALEDRAYQRGFSLRDYEIHVAPWLEKLNDRVSALERRP